MLKRAAYATALLVLITGSSEGASLSVIQEFTGVNGANPRTGLVSDSKNVLYGTTMSSGGNGSGTVFSLTPPVSPSKAWSSKTLHSFANSGDANYLGPQGGRLVIDTAGRLYGMTYGVDCNQSGNRSVAFRLAPPTAGSTDWTAATLTTMTSTDGSPASGGLIATKTGRLYGTAVCGGAYGHGSIFGLVPPTASTKMWTKLKLLDFDGNTGRQPRGAGLVSDDAGNFYGTTSYGGAYGMGTVFMLVHPASSTGKWTRKTLVDFKGSNGSAPSGGLVRDTSGNLYGVTWSGGSLGYGTVYSVAPPAAGSTKWRLTILVNFSKAYGANPLGALTFSPDGKLYGAARTGGLNCAAVQGAQGCGALFELTRSTTATTGWTRRNLILFSGNNGAWPNGDLTVRADGKIYGTAFYGGSKNLGTVFELVP